MEHGAGALLRVVGSGPVGVAFALLAARAGFAPETIALERAEGAVPPAVARRVLALSTGSWQLLARIATPPRAAPIELVDVSVLGHPGRTRIAARDCGSPALGHVVRYGELLACLLRAADAAGFASTAAAASPSGVVVHAEGDAGDDASVRQFDQAALLGEVAAASPRVGAAFECFTPDGPLALLPLPEPSRYSLVWCASPEHSRRRAELAPEALSAELQSAFGWQLGELSVDPQPIVWPMVRRARRELVAGNEVWIGNAAQSLHPVAGQGLNLGLRDAFELASVLGDARAARRNLGLALERYRARRRLDRGSTIALTDTLARIFSPAPLRPLESIALSAIDSIPAARTALARQFMFGLR